MLEKPSVIEEPKDCPLCGKPAAHRGIVNFCPPEQFACSDSDCQMSKVSCSLEEGCLSVIIFLAILMAAVIAKFCGCAWID